MALRVVTTTQQQDEPPAEQPERQISYKRAVDATFAVYGLIDHLWRQANERVGQRAILEQRWIEDLLQYHGTYDDITIRELKAAGKSQLFINLTRPKTDTLEARLYDLLFPVDDRNYAINPTPVPELSQGAKLTVNRLMAAVKQANEAKQAGDQGTADSVVQEANELAAAMKIAQAEMDEAKGRAAAMQAEIDDQLVECQYPSESREVIHEACMLGTGVMKGPILTGKPQKSWRKTVQAQANNTTAMTPGMGARPGWSLVDSQQNKPGFTYVDIWSFFPDMRARKIEDSEGNFERHLMTEQQLRALAKVPGFDSEAIGRLIGAGSREVIPNFLTDLRSITGAAQTSGIANGLFHVWEFHGPITAQNCADIGLHLGKMDIYDTYEAQAPDPLAEINVVCWFCYNEILMFAEHPLDSGEQIYSVFTLCRDPGSLFGLGVPRLTADPQKAYAAAWRMMMDNAGLSSGPQIVIDEAVVEPVDYEWSLKARKLWRRKASAPAGRTAFETLEIDSSQAELASILELASRAMDEQSNIPRMQPNETGPAPQNTASGLAMLMTYANVDVRRIVKNWDDQMTTPNIRRVYHWNMQFNPKEYVKGDYCVDARGVSHLLVKDIQAQNLNAFAINYQTHPVYGDYLKPGPIIKAIANSNMLAASDVLNTQEEVDKIRAARPPQEDPKAALVALEHKNKMEQLAAEHDARMKELTYDRETAMIGQSGKQTADHDKEQLKLLDSREERDHKERVFAGEAAMTNLEATKGGGGSL
jgi:hypothetical protein